MATVINGDSVTTPTLATSDGFDSSVTGSMIADNWRLASEVTADGLITTWEHSDNTTSANIGTPMGYSGGLFTFPTNGIYLINLHAKVTPANNDNVLVHGSVSTDDASTWEVVLHLATGGTGSLDRSMSGMVLVRIADASNSFFKFETLSMSSGSRLRADTYTNTTSATFIKLGEA